MMNPATATYDQPFSPAVVPRSGTKEGALAGLLTLKLR
jgi:hypothetical protein